LFSGEMKGRTKRVSKAGLSISLNRIDGVLAAVAFGTLCPSQGQFLINFWFANLSI